jgi:bifunctional ADP-heptose synthase (sugar kinase/adenylyltransferase)
MIDLQNTFSDFESRKIIILGDVMVDTYLNGSVTRISPEAPVPVVKFKSRESRLGWSGKRCFEYKSLRR